MLAEGRELLQQAKNDEAAAMFQRATKFYPNSAASHVALAQAQQIMKDGSSASRNFARALELDPGNREAAAALQRPGGREVATGSVSSRFPEHQRTVTFERSSDGAVAGLIVRTANGTRRYERVR